MDAEHEILFRNIDREMRAKGWSIVSLAKAAGINAKRIYDFRSGDPLSTESLYRIAKALGTTIDALKGIEELTPERAAATEQLSIDEQEILLHLRRVPVGKRRAAVKVFREMVDSLIDS